MSFTQAVTRTHEPLATALAPMRGRVLNSRQISDLYAAVEGPHPEWVIPADHCVNHTNDGACSCSCKPEAALLWRLGRNTYLVLGAPIEPDSHG